jgi:hypothetical protein
MAVQTKQETMTARERALIRDLAKRVAALASRPIEQEKRELWYGINALEPVRPVLFCDPDNSWREIVPPMLECESAAARGWEYMLRREIFWGEQIRDDRVITGEVHVRHVYEETGWGLEERRIEGEIPRSEGGSIAWDPPLKDYERDLEKLRFPQITIDWEATEKRLERAQDLLGDILDVKLKNTWWWWSLGMTGHMIKLRGMERAMLDMYDKPDGLHALMAFLRDGMLHKIDWLEERDLLYLDNDGSYIGSGAFGWCRELPQPDFDSPENGGHVRPIDLWCLTESQETVGVGPEMFEEFIFPYQYEIQKRFGLNCYGCCEPIDSRWHIVKRTPRLRRVSVSPWADVDVMAEQLGPNYVLSRKPTPAYIARPKIEEALVRREIRDTLEAAKRHNCRVELVMKDVHTMSGNPQHAVRWVEIAREEIANIWEA